MSVLYSKAQSNIRTGDVVAWKPYHVGDWVDLLLVLYHKIFRSTYKHVGIVVRLGGVNFVLEALPNGVRLFPLERMVDFYWVQPNVLFSAKQVKHLLSWVGRPYSLMDFLCYKLRLKRSDMVTYCSEMIAEIYKELGYFETVEVGQTPDTLIAAFVQRTSKEPVFIEVDRGNL